MLKSITKLIILLIAISCTASAQVVVNVPGGDPDNPVTVQAAIDDLLLQGVSGAMIVLDEGLYTGQGNYNIRTWGLPVTITSLEPDNPDNVAATIIDCQNQGVAFIFDGGETNQTVVTGLRIINGKGSYVGGAMIFSSGSSPVIRNCIISDSSAVMGGAIGVLNSDSAPRIANCWIIGNTATFSGGGVCFLGGDAIMENCIISGNYAPSAGGVYSFSAGNPTLINCTITGNESQTSAGGIWCTTLNNLTMNSCILWGNVAGSAAQLQVDRSGIVQASYCDIQGLNDTQTTADILVGLGGTANLDATNIQVDPMFVQPGFFNAEGAYDIGDLRLAEDSALIDAGDPAYDADGKTDVYGKTRLFGDAVDIGAAEFVVEEVQTLKADIRLWPKVINFRGKQNFFFCTIKVEDQDTADVDKDSIRLIYQDTQLAPKYVRKFRRARKLFARFDMDQVRNMVEGVEAKTVVLKVTGTLKEGQMTFEGSDTLKIYRKKHCKEPEEKKREKLCKKVKEKLYKHKKKKD